jgi:hypothetical protein
MPVEPKPPRLVEGAEVMRALDGTIDVDGFVPDELEPEKIERDQWPPLPWELKCDRLGLQGGGCTAGCPARDPAGCTGNWPGAAPAAAPGTVVGAGQSLRGVSAYADAPKLVAPISRTVMERFMATSQRH